MSNSKEAEFEKSIDVMSTTIAECTVKVKEGVCNKDTCHNCDLHQWLNNCLLQLPDIYKIRIMNDVKEKVALYEAVKEQEELNNAPQKELTTKEKIGIYLYNFRVMYLDGLGKSLSIVFLELLGMIGIPLLLMLLLYSCVSCSSSAYAQSLNDYDYARYALPGERNMSIKLSHKNKIY